MIHFKIYKTLLYNSILLFMIGCSTQKHEFLSSKSEIITVSENRKIRMKNISAAQCRKSIQLGVEDIDSNAVVKSEGKIVLSFVDAQKDNLVLNDIHTTRSDDVDQVVYEYIGLLKRVNMHLIKVKYYEAGEFLLVNAETGTQTKMWGIPKVSPDKKHIIAASNAVGYDMMPNGIQMWSIIGGELQLDWEYNQEKWAPLDIDWISKDKFCLKRSIPDFVTPDKSEKIFFSEITID